MRLFGGGGKGRGQVEEYFESKRLEFGLPDASGLSSRRLVLTEIDNGRIEQMVLAWYWAVIQMDERAQEADLVGFERNELLAEMADNVPRYKLSGDADVLQELRATADLILSRHGASFELVGTRLVAGTGRSTSTEIVANAST